MTKQAKNGTTWTTAFLAGGSACILYLWTLAPTFTFGDSGDFVAASVTLGIAHPPGYPVSILLGKIISLLPFPGEIAWRINALSALCAGVATLILTKFLLEFLRETLPDLDRRSANLIVFCCGLGFAFSRTFWSQAVIAEVYTLHVALAVGVIFLVERWVREGEIRYLQAAALLAGIDFAVHQSAALLWPALGWRIGYRLSGPCNRVAGRDWLSLLGLGALGLSPILFVWLRSLSAPAVQSFPITSSGQFLAFWLQSSGGGFELGRLATLGWNLAIQLQSVARDCSPPVLLLAAYGLVALRDRNRTLYGFVLVGFTVAGLFSVIPLALLLAPNQLPDIPVFTLLYLPFFMMAIATGLGTMFLKWRRLAVVTLILVPLLPLVFNLAWCDRRGDVSARHYGQSILRALPEGAAVAAIEDSTCYPLSVLQFVERERPDVLLWPLLLGSTQHRERVLDPSAYPAAVRGRRLFVDFAPAMWGMVGRMTPGSPVHELHPEAAMATQETVSVETLDGIVDPVREWLATNRPGSAHHWGRRVFASLYVTQGLFLSQAGREADAEVYYRAALEVDGFHGDALQRLAERALESERLEEAEALLDRLLSVAPFEPEGLVTLGRLWIKRDLPYQAIAEWERARRSDSRNLRSRLFLAKAYQAQGERAKMRACLREALAIDPSSEAARGMLK